MKRWWVVIALLLSLGINLGLLAALAGGWWSQRGTADEVHADGGDGGEAWPGGHEGPAGPAGPGPHLPPHVGPPLERVADHLGLEGDTRQRFLDLQRELIREMSDVRLRRAELDRELRGQLTATAPDEARIEELTAAKAELVLEAERATTRTILETRGLLDSEQQRRYLHVLQRLRGAGPGPPPGRGRRRPPERP